MARAREDGMDSFFNILEMIVTMEGDGKQLIHKMENCGADCEPEEFDTTAIALEQEQLCMQESIKLIRDELTRFVD